MKKNLNPLYILTELKNPLPLVGKTGSTARKISSKFNRIAKGFSKDLEQEKHYIGRVKNRDEKAKLLKSLRKYDPKTKTRKDLDKWNEESRKASHEAYKRSKLPEEKRRM